MNFTKAERISLKRHDTLNENWVQSLIAADPKHSAGQSWDCDLTSLDSLRALSRKLFY